ncbi:MAG: hypothetical protein ED557_02760 [Balneola sp.]|nr:MAG: hypothetical protein ED557_02760 [Balneola sp.]
MSSYSDIIFLSAALVVFSSLAVNTARNYQTTSQNRYKSDIEFRAIAVAQDEIDKVQWIYDQAQLNSASPSYIYSNYPKTETLLYGSSQQYSENFSIEASSELIEDSMLQKRYRVTVIVTNNQVSPDISVTLNYIKTYAK